MSNLSFEEYKKIDAINATFLKACHKSPYDGWHSLHSPFEPTDAMDVGTAIHAILLEPELFNEKVAVIPADAPKRPTKPQLEAFEKFPTLEKPTKVQVTANEKVTKLIEYWSKFDADNASKTVIDQDEYKQVLKVKERCLAIPHVAEALRTFEKEKTVVWDHPQYGKMKSRFDLVNLQTKVFIDIKKTNDAEVRAFVRQLINLRYDIQMRAYWDAIEANGCYVIAIEAETAQVACYDITKIVTSMFTDKRYHNSCEVAVEVKKMNDCPPKFKPEIIELELPLWAENEAV